MSVTLLTMRLLGIAVLVSTIACTQNAEDEAADTAQVTTSDTSAIIAHTLEMLYRDPEDRTRVSMGQLRRLVSEYHSAHGELPMSLGDVLDPSLESRYRQVALSDAWGSRFRYSQDGDTMELLSAGPDQVVGTSDDLVERWAP